MSNACRMAPVSSSICGIVGASGSPPNMDPKKSNMESDPSSASASSSMPRACRMAPVSSSICASIWESVPPVSGLPTSSISRMAPVSSSICVIVWVSDCAWASSTTYAPDIAMQHAIAKMQCAAARGHARLGPRGSRAAPSSTLHGIGYSRYAYVPYVGKSARLSPRAPHVAWQTNRA